MSLLEALAAAAVIIGAFIGQAYLAVWLMAWNDPDRVLRRASPPPKPSGADAPSDPKRTPSSVPRR